MSRNISLNNISNILTTKRKYISIQTFFSLLKNIIHRIFQFIYICEFDICFFFWQKIFKRFEISIIETINHGEIDLNIFSLNTVKPVFNTNCVKQSPVLRGQNFISQSSSFSSNWPVLSKHLPQCDGSFEHPKQRFNLMTKKIFTMLAWNYAYQYWDLWNSVIEQWHVISNNVAFLQVYTQTILCSLLLSLETLNDVYLVA